MEHIAMEKLVKIRVLFIKENDTWVAQCLEHDIAAQGKTIEAVKTAFKKTVAGQCFLDIHHGGEPLAAIKSAPQYYFDKFETAEKLKYTFNINISDSDQVAAAAAEDVRVCLV
jgi:hypothetical protein